MKKGNDSKYLQSLFSHQYLFCWFSYGIYTYLDYSVIYLYLYTIKLLKKNHTTSPIHSILKLISYNFKVDFHTCLTILPDFFVNSLLYFDRHYWKLSIFLKLPAYYLSQHHQKSSSKIIKNTAKVLGVPPLMILGFKPFLCEC